MIKLINHNKHNHFSLIKPKKTERIPFIISSPHSGEMLTKYLYDKAVVNKKAYLSMKDMYINDISSLMKDTGVTILQSNISRIVIDLNRDINEIDPYYISNPPKNIKFNISDKVKSGIGLIFTKNTAGKEIYDKKVTWKDIEHKINNYYLPWHNILRKEIDKLYKEFGRVFILDLHSMPSESGYTNNISEIVIGNDFNKSCSKLSVKILSNIINSSGYKVSINDPYSGGHITKKYHSREKNIQCIQLEIRRDLYMNEENFEKKLKFQSFALNLKNIIKEFINEINSREEKKLAAE
tara:strand:- start:259 stop:1143 length:885 start_codon:yes stop_codon:yes gene_type:complete